MNMFAVAAVTQFSVPSSFTFPDVTVKNECPDAIPD
jgi:hypothetical protein